MKTKGIITFAATSLILGASLSAPTFAEHHEAVTTESATVHDDTDRMSDAWREGKLDTLYLFNRHLNNFTIDPEVRGSNVTLTGKVESDVDKELAEQLAMGIDGITDVDNELVVVGSDEARANADTKDREFSDKVEDATLTAEVKMKLLANGETGGLGIDVDTVARAVTLTGEVDSSAEKDLAGVIAKNVDGVTEVNNKLEIDKD